MIAGHLRGRGYPGAGFSEVLYLVNVDTEAARAALRRRARQATTSCTRCTAQPGAADRRAAEQARYDAASRTLHGAGANRRGVRGGVTGDH